MASQGKGLTSFLLILVLILGAAVFLIPAPAIKWAIENYGSEQVGAKVEVDDVSFSWFSSAISVSGLQVTDPDTPMQNMLVIDQMETAIDVVELLNSKLYFDEVSVQGIGLGEPRETSGALGPKKLSTGEEGGGLSLESLGLPNSDALIAKEKAIYEKKIQAYQDKLAKQKSAIEKAIAELPGDESLQKYKDRIAKAKKKAKGPLGNFAALQDYGRIQKDVKRDVKRVKDVQSLIKQAMAELKKDYDVIKQLPNQSASEIIATLGLEKSVIANGGEMLLGGKVDAWVKEGLQAYGLLAGDNKKGESDGSTDGTSAQQTTPDFLVRRALLSGRLSQGVQEGEISGLVANISDRPSLYPEPMTVDIKAAGELLGKLRIEGVVDHRVEGKEKDAFTLSLADSSLVDYPLTEQSGVAIVLNKALLTGDASISVSKLKDLDIKVNALFDQLKVKATSLGANEASEMQVAIIDALEKVTEISIEGKVKGTMAEPKVALASNLDAVLGSVVNALVKKKMAGLTDDIRSRLESELANNLPSLDESLNGLNGLQNQTGDKRNAIDGLLKQIK